MILALSDVHGWADRLGRILREFDHDLLLISGDLSNCGKGLREVERVLDGDPAPVVLVPGNMDPPELMGAPAVGSAANAHGRVVEAAGLRVGGVGGSTPTPHGTPNEIPEGKVAEILSRLGEVDVLLTHSPPRPSRLDLLPGGGHGGSAEVARFLLERRPRLCVCGHIHEARGIERLGETLAVNPGPAYRLQAAVIHWGGGDPSARLVRP